MTRKQFIQRSILTLAVIHINPSVLFSSLRIKPREFEDVWKRYYLDPSDANARKVYNAIPLYKTYDRDRQTTIFFQLEAELDPLETHLKNGSLSALELAFKLHVIVDGAFASYMNSIIGPFMHLDATGFLQTLLTHRHLVSVKKVIGNYGLDMVDEFELQNQETEKRIVSLKTVYRPELRKIKEECLSYLSSNFWSSEMLDSNRIS